MLTRALQEEKGMYSHYLCLFSMLSNLQKINICMEMNHKAHYIFCRSWHDKKV
jgi:hypothetical protein